MSTHPTIESVTSRTSRTTAWKRAADAIRRRPLEAFFIVTFAYSWAPSVCYALTNTGPPILGCGPFLAAITVLWVTQGRAGVRPLVRAMTTWRVPARWWAFAVLAPIVVTLTATLMNIALGAPTPTSDDVGRWTAVLPTATLILLIPVIGGAWEEPGWRGFALPRLLAERSPLGASLILGVIWAAWHLPVFLAGDQHWSDLSLVVAVTVVLTWLFRNALGSVLIAMVFHAMNNAVSGEYFSQMFDGSDSTRQSWLLVLIWGAAAALIACFARDFRAATSMPATTSTHLSVTKGGS